MLEFLLSWAGRFCSFEFLGMVMLWSLSQLCRIYLAELKGWRKKSAKLRLQAEDFMPDQKILLTLFQRYHELENSFRCFEETLNELCKDLDNCREWKKPYLEKIHGFTFFGIEYKRRELLAELENFRKEVICQCASVAARELNG